MEETQRLLPVYSRACPNCGGPAPADRLLEGLPCPSCLPQKDYERIREIEDYYERVEAVGRTLSENGRLRGYALLYTTVREMRLFEEFFRKAVGSSLWSAQLTWAKRLLAGESIAIVAPTGVGKTTLLSVYAVYRATEGAKVYYLLPTENLVRQVYDKIVGIAGRTGSTVSVAVYYSSMPRKRRESELAKIASGEYSILVTTTSFLSRQWKLLEGKKFDVVLVDDVDAVLRNSKNVERLLVLLGFSWQTIATAYSIIKKKVALVVAKASGNYKRYMKILEDLKTLEAQLVREVSSIVPGQLVIASATGRARGLKPKLFRELLGFEIGRVYDYTRSIANFYLVTEDPVEAAVGIVEKLGSGGIIYVASRLGKDTARKLVEKLNARGVRAALALSGRRVLEKFERGEYDVIVGIATYYGVVVRGVDMPHRVLYTVFIGVPGSSVDAEKALNSPFTLSRVALSLNINGAEQLVKMISRLSPSELTVLRIALANGEKISEGRLAEVYERLVYIKGVVIRVLREKLCGKEEGATAVIGGVYFRCNNGRLETVSVDAATYVQASGRASRMLGSAMTHGVSIVLEEDRKLVELLSEKLKRFIEDAVFTEYSWSAVVAELKKAVESRRNPSKAKKVDIETSLIVVESPTKAKTIASFFGRPIRRRLGSLVVYETTFYNNVSGKIHVAAITASVGHLYDLSVDGEGIHGVEVDFANAIVKPYYKPVKKCLNCGHTFSSDSLLCPRCGSGNIVTKEEIVAALRQLASEYEIVYIATDPDIEGEKIAFDLYLLLRPYSRRIMRIELHEITRRELFKALASPRNIDIRMVSAQVVRRIEDRWIGFGLSQRLWEVFGKNWLGAGRVQTPVLGWVIDRYREYRENRGYNLYIKTSIGARIRLHYRSASEARRAEANVSGGLQVASTRLEEQTVNPPPPFTTEALIYEASKRFGYPAQKTMRIAQELFEAGLITYHRTDSQHVSAAGIAVAREYLERNGLKHLFRPRSWGPPGHHEAIRPTKPISADELRKAVATGSIRLPIALRESHYRVYDLIFRRFIASQMSESTVEIVDIVLKPVGSPEPTIEARLWAREKRKGFISIYQPTRLYPEAAGLSMGDTVGVVETRVAPGSTVQLYSHGDVVRLMKERGIGRPSTYARTIEAIIRHGYVIESRYRKRLIPTRLGIDVYSYLANNYHSLVSEERTRKLLEEIDLIVQGALNPLHVLEELYAEMSELLAVPRTLTKGVGVEAEGGDATLSFGAP